MEYMTRVPKRVQVREWATELGKLSWFLERLDTEDACCGNLTPRQCVVLSVLKVGVGTRLSDLAAATGISASAMTRALDKLERQGLVNRVHGELSDGRASTVELTEAGNQTCCQFDRHTIERTAALVSAIPIEVRKEILTSIQKLNKAFEEAGCCSPDPTSALKKCSGA